MAKFRGMGGSGFVATILILACFLSTCSGFSFSHSRSRTLIDEPPSNASTSPKEISPVRSPGSSSNTSSVDTNAKSTPEAHEKTGMNNQSDDSSDKSNTINDSSSTNSNNTTKNHENSNTDTALPADSKGSKNNDTMNEDSVMASPPPGAKNDSSVDGGGEKDDDGTRKKMDTGACVGSLTTCRDKEMFACIEISGEGSNSKEMFLVVQNEGESTLKVNVRPPDSLQNLFPAFDVPKHDHIKKDISLTFGKNTKLVVDSVDAKCTLLLPQPISVDNLMQQLSFYSKQVTPVYGVYALFLVTLLFGGTWACCKLRKRRHENGIAYHELEMAVPESTSNVNVDSVEGWDHDWDDDDWDEENAVRSPSMHGVRNLSADGLISRAARKDGWDDDWED